MSGVHAGNAQVYLFQNYALLQRPPDSCLKALDKFAWQSFGLEAEVLYQPSNACVHLDMQERQFLHCQRFSIESCCVLPKSHVISCRKSQLHVFLPAVIAVCIQKIALPLLHLTDEFTTLQCQTPLCGPLDPLFLPATQPHLAATQLLSFSFQSSLHISVLHAGAGIAVRCHHNDLWRQKRCPCTGHLGFCHSPLHTRSQAGSQHGQEPCSSCGH